MHICGSPKVSRVQVMTKQWLPCGAISASPRIIQVSHPAGFDVEEHYRLSETTYCKQCLTWFGRDTSRRVPYAKMWASRWPALTAYLLGTNVASSVWGMLPPKVRTQWRGLLHPNLVDASCVPLCGVTQMYLYESPP